MSVNHVYVIGYPSDIGGANTELWHLVKLWRRYDLGVSLIPTWKAPPEWEERLSRIGCKTLVGRRLEFPVPDGAVCFAMCNAVFERYSPQLQARGCRCIYMPCMNYLQGQQLKHHQKHPPWDRYVFQSLFQFQRLTPELAEFGVHPSQCYLIRGAFIVDEEWPYTPREHNGTPFVVGRLSRPDPAKFAAETWELYAKIRERMPDLRVRIMGWNAKVERKCGCPPEWAECLPVNTETPQAFLQSLHCLVQANDRDRNNMYAAENWPRVGLEAMATGVPVVADQYGGWIEMVHNGRVGYLGHTLEAIAHHVATLANDEEHRQTMARIARHTLEQRIANPDDQWAAWQKVFEGLE